MTPECWKALAQGATLLTANRRLARHLREAFVPQQQAQGLEVWPSADILPLSAWLGRCWEEALETAPGPPPEPALPLLLSEPQALALWESLIAKDGGDRGLLMPSGAARSAQQAWNLLQAWRLELPPHPAELPVETRVFMRWRDEFQARCRSAGWATSAELPQRVARLFAQGRLSPPREVWLAGFDEFTPQQEALLQALRSAGTAVTEVEPPPREGRAIRMGCADAEQEMETAARWARGLLERGAEGPIAVVVPELAALRTPIERIFTAVLAPASLLPGAKERRCCNISHGIPLADFPLVNAALAFLDLGGDALELERITHLVCSPFIAGAEEETHQRALLDARLREFGSPALPLAAIIRTAQAEQFREHPSPHRAPLLARHLSAWRDAFAPLRHARRPASAWAGDFSRLLSTLGWPGALKLDSDAYQTWGKLLELLSALAGLELVLPSVTHGEALAQLRKLAAQTQFQPEGGAAPVQILGELEAAGLAFDHLWVLGLHEGAWPRRAEPNPFLPAELQRARGLPQSSPARELAYAARVTERLRSAAGEAVFSHPLREGDQPLRPSPLIATLPAQEPAGLALSEVQTLGEAMAAGAALETLPDSRAPVLAAGEFARGGTALFKDQAACPFRAFATHRLHARALAEPGHGLDPAERGNLVHRAMDGVWARLQTSAHLNRLAPDSLAELVAEAVEEAVRAFTAEHSESMMERFLALENKRLTTLVLDFLEVEKGRAPFAVVGRELEKSFTVGGIEVNTRIDRVDQVENSGHVVIDYKTGEASTRAWQGARPEEPQLPLYCAAEDLDVAGVAFARLKRGALAFRGLERTKGLLPGARGFAEFPLPEGAEMDDPATAVLGHWHTVLERLGEAFRQGEAAVHPKNPSQTCRYCELELLCRVAEAPSASGGPGDPGGPREEGPLD